MVRRRGKEEDEVTTMTITIAILNYKKLETKNKKNKQQ